MLHLMVKYKNQEITTTIQYNMHNCVNIINERNTNDHVGMCDGIRIFDD